MPTDDVGVHNIEYTVNPHQSKVQRNWISFSLGFASLSLVTRVRAVHGKAASVCDGYEVHVPVEFLMLRCSRYHTPSPTYSIYVGKHWRFWRRRDAMPTFVAVKTNTYMQSTWRRPWCAVQCLSKLWQAHKKARARTNSYPTFAILTHSRWREGVKQPFVR